MTQKHVDHPNGTDQTGAPDQNDRLRECADLSKPRTNVTLIAPGVKKVEVIPCAAPPIKAPEKAALDNIANELSATTLLGLKEWVTPSAVLGALKAAKPTNAAQFEQAFQTAEGRDLRKELFQHLSKPDDYRTAISILENREGQKRVADSLETAMTPDWLHLKTGADKEETLKILKQIKPNELAQFEKDFPKNEGVEHPLRRDLAERLGKGDEFRTAIAILDNRQQEHTTANALQTALTQTHWLMSSPDVPAVMKIIGDMQPKDRVQFEQNFAKNVGDGIDLRSQLHKYLSPAEYDRAVTMLDEFKRSQPPPPVAEAGGTAPGSDINAAAKLKGKSSIGEWLVAFKKLNETVNPTVITDIDPNKVDEARFKTMYAGEALRQGSLYGFGPTQVKNVVQSIYGIEGGGWSTSYTTANMPPRFLADNQEDERLTFRPITSAVGYNQLLEVNTLAIVKDHGTDIASQLLEATKGLPKDDPRAQELGVKAQMMTTLSAVLKGESIPLDIQLSKKEFGDALQALNLDPDVGPLIQGQELGNLFSWYNRRNVKQLVDQILTEIDTKAKVFDSLSADRQAKAIKSIATLAKPTKTEAKVAASLTQKLQALKPGLDDSLTLTPEEKHMLTRAARRANALPATAPENELLTKVKHILGGKITADMLMPAAIELANLAGMTGAEGMLRHPHEPTSNYFSSDGLSGNKIAQDKDGQQLLLDIYRTMQINRTQQYLGNIQFRDAFDAIINRR